MSDHRPVDELLAELGEQVNIPGLTDPAAEIPEPPPIDKASIEKLDTDSPPAIVRGLGLVNDALAELAHGHANAAKSVKHWKGQVSAITAALTRRAEGKDAEARKQWVQELLHQSPQWANLQIADAKLAEYEVEFNYLSKQQSGLQSILKRFETERWERQGFGKGAGQGGG